MGKTRRGSLGLFAYFPLWGWGLPPLLLALYVSLPWHCCPQVFPICFSQGPYSPQTAQWCPIWCICCFLSSPACGGKLPKPVLGIECQLSEQSSHQSGHLSSVKATCWDPAGISPPALGSPPAPIVVPSSGDASQHLHLFQRHLGSFSLPSAH